ncbi:hypothetical protein NECAME_18575 [Necator americanus]|uniref:Uncharacterized protein n=1 Tax=Necator americanus TaxID=51031 RepID=W2SWA2_NECAM|nr:hypothetical protein NECAME_18575 [Necator americanus]ETN72982.1 hypothetical protein NECAME_18575 [Necator americanus]
MEETRRKRLGILNLGTNGKDPPLVVLLLRPPARRNQKNLIKKKRRRRWIESRKMRN